MDGESLAATLEIGWGQAWAIVEEPHWSIPEAPSSVIRSDLRWVRHSAMEREHSSATRPTLGAFFGDSADKIASDVELGALKGDSNGSGEGGSVELLWSAMKNSSVPNLKG